MSKQCFIDKPLCFKEWCNRVNYYGWEIHGISEHFTDATDCLSTDELLELYNDEPDPYDAFIEGWCRG